ncbi:hypothetical protein NIES2111_19870 [Nostoc sp. NIES-2111]|nr:hypothetical protein NIES2111_19870 [Nostoc sp. NIES-2111]
MERNAAYEKLVHDIKKKLIYLENEVNSIPDFLNPKDVFNILIKNNFNPLKIINSFDKTIKELSSEIDKLRSKAQNGIDYYTLGFKNTSLPTQINQQSENIQEYGYLSQFIDILTEIDFLDEKLCNKNFRQFMDKVSTKT